LHHSFREFGFELISKHGQDETKEKDQRTVTVISEHDSKHEWESNYGERSRVCFHVVRDTVSVDNNLEHAGDFVLLEVSRRVELVRLVGVISVWVEVGGLERS
jgi:hypothetical protein